MVRPYRDAMFSAHVSGQLAGLLVGVRNSPHASWRPAIDDITVTCVVSCGIRLNIGPWQDLGPVGDIGWPLFGFARAPFVVYVRNDQPAIVELRAVVVLHGGDGGGGAVRRRRLGSR